MGMKKYFALLADDGGRRPGWASGRPQRRKVMKIRDASRKAGRKRLRRLLDRDTGR